MSNKNPNNNCCIRTLKWIPVLFITAIVCWSHYAYVVEFCIFTINNFLQRLACLVVFHILFIMLFWTYLRTIFTTTGRVPPQFKLSDSEYERLIHAESDEMARNVLETFTKTLPTTNLNVAGTVRYCKKCRHIKPDRSHHCSVCGVCVLKMDHHCPWINNCVCFTNYKFFVLFLGYALLYCMFITATTAKYVIMYWFGSTELQDKFQVLFVFFVGLTFGVSLITLFGYHCYLVACNRTTLEAFRPAVFVDGPDKYGFDLGTYNNICEVFGKKVITWFIPIPTTLGDGVTYSKRDETRTSYYNMNSPYSSAEHSPA